MRLNPHELPIAHLTRLSLDTSWASLGQAEWRLLGSGLSEPVLALIGVQYAD